MKARAACLAGLAAAAALAGCGGSSPVQSRPPDRVEAIPGSPFKRVILTRQGAERIGIQTTVVKRLRVRAHGPLSAVIPYSAVIYDEQGRAYTYIRPVPLQYVRRPVVINRITAGSVFLRSGPRAGTRVVSVGAEELFGAELGVTSGE
ncbi:MAG: hypothetical protein ACJ764_00180 [Solirubrobacteraceae bacterium]